MKMMQRVYKFNAWFKDANGNVDYDNMQVRFVVAEDDEIADVKMSNYVEELKKNGFCELVYVLTSVEIDEVIF